MQPRRLLVESRRRPLALAAREPRGDEPVDVGEAVAEKKLRAAPDLPSAIATLSPQERARVLASPELLGLLTERAPVQSRSA